MSKYKVGDLIAIKNIVSDNLKCKTIIAVLEVKDAKQIESVGTFMYATEPFHTLPSFIREDEVIGRVTQVD